MFLFYFYNSSVNVMVLISDGHQKKVHTCRAKSGFDPIKAFFRSNVVNLISSKKTYFASGLRIVV